MNRVLQEALPKIHDALEAAKIAHALIGGYALAYHNIIRATEDLDFLIHHRLREGAAVVAQLGEREIDARFARGDFEDPLRGVIHAAVPTRSGPVQCDLVFAAKVWQAEAVSNATLMEFSGVVVPVVRARDLFLLKLHAGGPQDLLDAGELYKLQSARERPLWEAAARTHRLGRALKECLEYLPRLE